ncbi:uncharacterized protein ACRADG_006684 [Cochliomyia hominivorax]
MNKIVFAFAILAVVFAYTEASVKGPQRPDCLKLTCQDRSKTLLCVSSPKNNCQLLTACQVSRVNCQRGPKKALRKVDRSLCKGMRAGQKLRKCKSVPKKSG